MSSNLESYSIYELTTDTGKLAASIHNAILKAIKIDLMYLSSFARPRVSAMQESLDFLFFFSVSCYGLLPSSLRYSFDPSLGLLVKNIGVDKLIMTVTLWNPAAPWWALGFALISRRCIAIAVHYKGAMPMTSMLRYSRAWSLVGCYTSGSPEICWWRWNVFVPCRRACVFCLRLQVGCVLVTINASYSISVRICCLGGSIIYWPDISPILSNSFLSSAASAVISTVFSISGGGIFILFIFLENGWEGKDVVKNLRKEQREWIIPNLR